MARFLLVVLAGFPLLGIAAPASAQGIFCSVVSAKQGTFPGDRGAPQPSQIPVLFLTEEITRPTDAATGLATGVLTRKPLTIVKELDASSIHFFQAAVTDEVLRSVTCTFYRAFRNGTGERHAYFRITLTNAAIVDYRDSGDGSNGTVPGDERERISFTYQRIELTDLDSNSTAQDSWSAG